MKLTIAQRGEVGLWHVLMDGSDIGSGVRPHDAIVRARATLRSLNRSERHARLIKVYRRSSVLAYALLRA